MTEGLDETRDSNALIRALGHTLRGPLSGILQTTQVILRGIDGEMSQTVRDDVEEIQGCAEQAMETIDKILELLRIEISVPQVEVLDLSSTLRRIRDEDQIPALALNLPATLPPVNASGVGVVKVLRCLIRNIPQSSRQGALNLSAQTEGDSVIVSVGHHSKTGKQSSIEEYIQLKLNPPLNILDLLLCKRIIENLDGTLWVSLGKRPRTLCWSFSLPVSRTETPDANDLGYINN